MPGKIARFVALLALLAVPSTVWAGRAQCYTACYNEFAPYCGDTPGPDYDVCIAYTIEICQCQCYGCPN